MHVKSADAMDLALEKNKIEKKSTGTGGNNVNS
jgi:hypothetical protein